MNCRNSIRLHTGHVKALMAADLAKKFRSIAWLVAMSTLTITAMADAQQVHRLADEQSADEGE
jgi:hypothetical protein